MRADEPTNSSLSSAEWRRRDEMNSGAHRNAPSIHQSGAASASYRCISWAACAIRWRGARVRTKPIARVAHRISRRRNLHGLERQPASQPASGRRGRQRRAPWPQVISFIIIIVSSRRDSRVSILRARKSRESRAPRRPSNSLPARWDGKLLLFASASASASAWLPRLPSAQLGQPEPEDIIARSQSVTWRRRRPSKPTTFHANEPNLSELAAE